MNIEQCKCDLCGSEEYTILWDKAEQEPKALCKTKMILHNGEIIQGRDVICNNCGLVYKTPRMTKESLDEFYRDEYRKIYGGEKPHIESERFHANNAYSIIKDIPGSLLDIGCSTGQLLNLWQGDKAGVELSQYKPPKAYNYIKDVPKQYDIVTMLNALEHVYSPTETLQEIWRICKQYLLISVPNLLNSNIKIPVGAYLSNAHIYTFGVDTIIHLLLKCGFKPIRVHFITEEIGDKMYMISEKTEPIQPTFGKPDIDNIKAFIDAWDKLYTAKRMLGG